MLSDIKRFLNHRVKITAKQDRYYEGDLLACDQYMNIVMSDTEEFSMVKSTRRYLGLCVFRGSFVTSIDVVAKLPL